jgi:murein DD-endopeptidase MepM/ murein hydrolase activator NlpD
MHTTKTYSILVLRGTEMRRFAVSQGGVRRLVLAGLTVLCLAAWFFEEYRTMQQEKVEQVLAKSRVQQEKLSVLQAKTDDVRELLSRWKGLKQKIQASVPRTHKVAADREYGDEELQEMLALLQSELKQMIAALPSEWPVQGRVASGLGMRQSPWTGEMQYHAGLDIPKPIGTPVQAAGDALVESTDARAGSIVLDHGQEIKTIYAHLSKILVNKGERVRKGQPIGQVGNTGKSTGPHLHYEVRVKGVPIDPRQGLLTKASPE